MKVIALVLYVHLYLQFFVVSLCSCKKAMDTLIMFIAKNSLKCIYFCLSKRRTIPATRFSPKPDSGRIYPKNIRIVPFPTQYTDDEFESIVKAVMSGYCKYMSFYLSTTYFYQNLFWVSDCLFGMKFSVCHTFIFLCL
ncbi:hypothetical protein HPP92_019440 [Vanilla planifolia]|uniref:Uncharacterized protein n=1 Tax=Vanilla planifolia TaxID=51239 RepID=A0A835PZF4_VANPL|nr:hypothetical protein HPP92_019440 [Vanilla planifolia]